LPWKLYRRLRAETPVDVGKPENNWETLGEQLVPNKGDFVATPVFHPPLIIDSKQQGLPLLRLLNRGFRRTKKDAEGPLTKGFEGTLEKQ
jgi:hypothetical protein